ncbi:MAG: hypothetical protein Q7W45_16040 [Bacteroidota bacterium]|nr:hypothetical protein [Bacteroidota bacterium]MDP3145473.1 hypothetical protein [Bacteroidota bacterium]
MSSHDNHDNHSNEVKPVSFTVPFILASVTLVIIFMFLSLCDPKKHGECECKEDCSTECKEACEKGDHSLHPSTAGHDDHHAMEAKEVHAESKDTMSVETVAPAVDETHAAHGEHH